MSTVRDIYRIACPQCGEDDHIEVLVQTLVELSPDGTSEVDNPVHEWTEVNHCGCRACGFRATVAEFEHRKVGAS